MEWSGRRVVIIGAARQGLALARYLAAHGAQVVLNDQRPAEKLHSERLELEELPITWILGGHPLDALDGADLVCPSGGVPLTLPLVIEAQRRGIPLSNDSQIFLETVPCPVIGITGSAGKTTTTTLVGRIAEAAVKLAGRGKAFTGGNIGSPLVAVVDEMAKEDVAVMELSSFQLEIMTRSPQVAAVLNVTPNHLDRHGSMQIYAAAKAHILQHQNQEDAAVLGRDDPGAWELRKMVKGKLWSFGLDAAPRGENGTYLEGENLNLMVDGHSSRLFHRDLVGLRGAHNLLNVLAACAISAAAGFPLEAMVSGVQGFRGVPHRLEFVRRWSGADWYNDSIATAPERSMAAIRSFDEPLVLLAGGRDKDLPWDDFARLVSQRVDHLILFGEAAGKIGEAMAGAVTSSRPSVEHCSGLQAAVHAAARLVEPGDVVLLSPGGTSFDEFKDFEERGVCFRKWVHQL